MDNNSKFLLRIKELISVAAIQQASLNGLKTRKKFQLMIKKKLKKIKNLAIGVQHEKF